MHPPTAPARRRCAPALPLLGLAAAILPLAGSIAADAAPPAGRGGKVVVADRASGTISAIAARSDEVVATVAMPDAGEPMYVVYSPIGRRVLVGDRANDRVVSFDARTFEVQGVAAAGAGVFHMWAHTGLGELWVNNDVENSTSVIDLHTLDTLATIPTPEDLVALGGKPHDVFIGPRGDLAYVSVIGVDGPNDYVVQYDTATLEEVGRAAVGGDPHLSATSQVRHLFVPCQDSDGVWVLDRFTMDVVDVLDVPGAHGAAIANNGQTFYTTNLPGGGDDALFAIDTRTLEVLGSVDAPHTVPHNIVATPNGRTLYVTHSGMNDTVTIYETSKHDPPLTLVGEVTVGMNPFGLDYVP